MYPAHTQLVAKWSSPSIGDQRATGCQGLLSIHFGFMAWCALSFLLRGARQKLLRGFFSPHHFTTVQPIFVKMTPGRICLYLYIHMFQGEDAIQFANRVKKEIARKGAERHKKRDFSRLLSEMILFSKVVSLIWFGMATSRDKRSVWSDHNP